MSGRNDPLGERMKGYEAEARLELPKRSLAAIRIDGRAFHTWTRGLPRPYSRRLMDAMAATTQALCEEVSGSVIGYTQSDEISIVFQDFAKLDTQRWFGGSVQKICSVSASIATAHFARAFWDRPPAAFDARVFALPSQTEAMNYLLWRQRDAQRNAISMLAEDRFSAKSLHGQGTPERRERLQAEGVDLDAEDPRFLHGQCLHRITVEEKVRYFDKRLGEEVETPQPVVRRRWAAGAAPQFSADPGGFLAQHVPEQAQLAERPA